MIVILEAINQRIFYIFFELNFRFDLMNRMFLLHVLICNYLWLKDLL